jgi:predicted nucleic acid-binding protein
VTAPAFFDTNVLVYLFANEDPEKQQVAERLYLERCGDGSGVVSTQVLQEFYSVATATMRRVIRATTGRLAVQEFTMQHVVQMTPALVLKAIDRSVADQLAIWDALIVEAALAGGCRTLYSEDFQDGRAFGPLRVVNPFRAE